MAAVGPGTVGGNSNTSSAERWFFTAAELANSASRACGIDADKELAHRQHTANLIQEMGQRLHVNQLCINTAIVYMHRFYRFHSFAKFNRNDISQCALFLAAKVEEQPRKLEHVIKCARAVLSKGSAPLDPNSEEYSAMAGELVANENLMLQTLGFDIGIDHPHTHVVKCCQLVKASKELAQTSYFLATNTLHFTTMCLQYKPTVVACLCIHIACKWTLWQIPTSTENKQWFNYIDETVTIQLLEELSTEFLACLDKCPERMRNRIYSCMKSKDLAPSQTTSGGGHRTHLQPPSTQTQLHKADQNAPLRLDPNRGLNRTAHPTHQPDSTTLIADRRKTLPPNLQTQQQPTSSHGHRPSGHHSNSSSSDRFSYNKEHQRAPQTQIPANNSSQGRHSLPASTKSAQQVSGVVHPKKQYQQQHYLGGQQQQQQQPPPPPLLQQQQQQSQSASDNKPRGNNSVQQQLSSQGTQHLIDQGRRAHVKSEVHNHHHHHQQHQQQQQQAIHHSSSMASLNAHVSTKDIKALPNARNQMIGVVDESSGLLKPADFSQPYPSCASPPAHNPMFEGDSSSMENDFLSGIVSQTSPNTNSGSNSLGFGGSFSHQKHLSPPETQHNLSPPQPFVASTFGVAETVIPKKDALSAMPPSIPITKQEVAIQQALSVSKTQVPLSQTVKQEIPLSNSINVSQQQAQGMIHSQYQLQQQQQQHQQQQQLQMQQVSLAEATNMAAVGGVDYRLLDDEAKPTPNTTPKANALPLSTNEGHNATVTNSHPALSRHVDASQELQSSCAVTPVVQSKSQTLHPAHFENKNPDADNKVFSGHEQTEIDGGKKHKKKKEKKEKKEKRHKDEKKKKKKKDKDRDRERRSHSRSRSRSRSPVASSGTPVFQPIQMGGVKLKIKVIAPNKHVAGSDSDSNANGGNNGAVAGTSLATGAGSKGDTNLKIKIPIDKFDSDRKDKRKRKDDFYDDSSSKLRKFH